MKLELAGMCPESRTIEMLHKAAYRTGLGNSLYAPDYSAGKHKHALMKEFFDKNATNQRAVLVGIGIDHGDLQKYATILQLENGQGKIRPCRKISAKSQLNPL
jgi:ubiquinol-cytochrome c reductase core subunit 2